ncbi:NACHT domain-containing protein [Actinoplanes sp. NPDC020271]|uniref:NACHT domain-containing protein n=1 Tax=Actinoplanes sp. NPDC020271 TaxID=3363896 RepID=UPI0037B1EC9E
MARAFTYADAIRLLGGTDQGIAEAVATGGDVPSTDVLRWFGGTDEVVHQSRTLLRRLTERRNALDPVERGDSLSAAHTVIVVSAFFESLAEVRLPVELTRGAPLPQTGTAGIGDFTEQIRSAGLLVPSPEQIPASFDDVLRRYYLGLADRLHQFITDLAGWEKLPFLQRNRITRQLTDAASHAALRYREALRLLAIDFPEVSQWATSRDEGATSRPAVERKPDAWRRDLARVYQAYLQRPIVRSVDVETGVRIPVLDEGFISPSYRVAEIAPHADVTDESWWAGQPVRDDLQEFLLGYLTSPRAVDGPLLILGHPGAGKSLLTRVLAARLPVADFMAIRVPLREVSAAGEVMEQIEDAVREATGERIPWPTVARLAGDALPVVILDGFDELLQAAGVRHSDYLERVARFQRREAEIGRPVAAIVTSRIVVADRVRLPARTVVLRLEPFDEGQVAAWIDVWNKVNAPEFTRLGRTPLTLEIVLAQRDLATQPLWLLMLALQHLGGEHPASGYEGLLSTFVRREIGKRGIGLSVRDLERAAESEIHLLSVAAFAMFNRDREWVTHYELDADLRALAPPDRSPAQADLRAPLSASELLLSRFFFVRRAQTATSDEEPPRTYKFLHATFGEFLVSRLTWDVLQSMTVRGPRFGTIPLDDELLRSLLSHQPLSQRSRVPAFLTEMAAGDAQVRDPLLKVFQSVNHASPQWNDYGYVPTFAGVPARYATYAANVLLLILCTGPVRAGQLYPDHADPVQAWHSQALLWKSQLSAEGWRSLVDSTTVDRIRTDDGRDIRIALGSGPVDPVLDPLWAFRRVPVHDADPLWLHRENHFQCGFDGDIVHHGLEPLTRKLPWTLTAFPGDTEHGFVSAARALVEIWTDPSPLAYRAAAAAADATRDGYSAYAELLLNRLSTADGMPSGAVADILDAYLDGPGRSEMPAGVADSILRCVLTFLGRQPGSDRQLTRAVTVVIDTAFEAADPVLVVDALVRLREQDLPAELPAALHNPEGRASLMRRVTPIRPDLEARLQAVIDNS